VSTTLEQVRLLDPRLGRDETGSFLIKDDGSVSQLSQVAAAPTTALLVPGVIDLYARLREPGIQPDSQSGASQKASVRSEASAAFKLGITSIICAPDTEPCIDSTAVVELIRDRARATPECALARVLPLASFTKDGAGLQLSEYATLRNAGCVAISNGDGAITNSALMRRALQYAASFDIRVCLHPVDHFLSEDGVAHDGRIAARLGLPGVPESAETLALARDLMLIEEAGARAHISRISCARSVWMIKAAKARGVKISCDVALANLFLCETDLIGFRANCHVWPPLRRAEDRDALIAGLADGSIDAICSNHAPLDRDAKLAPFGMTKAGASTLDALIPLSLSLVHAGKISLARWVELLCVNPARILGIENRDWIVLAPDQRVRLDQLQSAGKNSPFAGWESAGVVQHTILASAS
jgi:dihydroorotase